MSSGSPACNRWRWAERVRRMVTASRAASSTGATDPPARSESSSSFPGVAQLLEDLLLALAEQFGEDPVHDDGRHADRGLLTHPVRQLERLAHRHLLGRADSDEPRLERVGEDVEHPVGLAADQPHLHEVVDGLGGRQLPDDMPAGRCVHDDQVVVALLDLPAELPDGEDLPHPGAAVATKSKALASGPMRPTTGMRRCSLRYSRSEASVSIDIDHTPGAISRGREVGRGRLEERRDVPLGIDLADEDALSPFGGQLGQARSDRRLAHAPLAGDEHQAEVQEIRGRAHHRRACHAAVLRVRRTRLGGHPPVRPPRRRRP